MKKCSYQLSLELFSNLEKKYPNIGKNSDIGKYAVEVAKAWLGSCYQGAKVTSQKRASNLQVDTDEEILHFKVRGTEAADIGRDKLKVSSREDYQKLRDGMPIIRISKIRQPIVDIYLLKYEIDFDLEIEERWNIKIK